MSCSEIKAAIDSLLDDVERKAESNTAKLAGHYTIVERMIKGLQDLLAIDTDEVGRVPLEERLFVLQEVIREMKYQDGESLVILQGRSLDPGS